MDDERSRQKESVDGSEWGGESVAESVTRVDARETTLRKSVVDGIWKAIMEPAQEYSRVSQYRGGLNGC